MARSVYMDKTLTGCFNSRSGKMEVRCAAVGLEMWYSAPSEEQDLSFQFLISLQNDEYGVPLPEEDFKPKGPSWLYHSDAIRTYLCLMDQSKKDATLEACAGALQNLTASRGLVSALLPSARVFKSVNTLQWSERKRSFLNLRALLQAFPQWMLQLRCSLMAKMGFRGGGYNQHPKGLSQIRTLSRCSSRLVHLHQHLLVLAPPPRTPVRMCMDVHRCAHVDRCHCSRGKGCACATACACFLSGRWL